VFDKYVRVLIMRVLIFLLSLSAWNAFAGFSDKGMLPMDTQWWECKMGGPTIQCKTEDCVSQCNEILQAEKEQKEEERTEILQNVLDDALKAPEADKNPALYQLQN